MASSRVTWHQLARVLARISMFDVGDVQNVDQRRLLLDVDSTKRIQSSIDIANAVRTANGISNADHWPEYLNTTKSSLASNSQSLIRRRYIGSLCLCVVCSTAVVWPNGQNKHIILLLFTINRTGKSAGWRCDWCQLPSTKLIKILKSYSKRLIL